MKINMNFIIAVVTILKGSALANFETVENQKIKYNRD